MAKRSGRQKEDEARTEQAREVVEEIKDDLGEIIKKLPKPPSDS